MRSSRRAPIRDSRCVALGLSVIGALGVTSPTQAQEPEEETHIDYAVPLGCPSEDAFLVQVRARTSRFRETADAIRTWRAAR